MSPDGHDAVAQPGDRHRPEDAGVLGVARVSANEHLALRHLPGYTSTSRSAGTHPRDPFAEGSFSSRTAPRGDPFRDPMAPRELRRQAERHQRPPPDV